MRLYLKILLLGLGLFFMAAQPPDYREYQVKAVFLYNFTQFVGWPSATFPEASSPLIIGILGDDPFGTYLQETVKDEKVNGHPLIIQHYKSVDEMKACHVLFINLPESNKMQETLTTLKGKSVLTVGETNNFIKQGGIIRFFTRDSKIQIQINPDEAKADNLTISSKLLRVAEIVVPKAK